MDLETPVEIHIQAHISVLAWQIKVVLRKEGFNVSR
jgi:hypothetical protein